MADSIPGYAGPVVRGAIGGGLLGAGLGALLGWMAHLVGFDVGPADLPLWAAIAAGLAAVQGATHLALLRHRKRQELIHGVDDDHDHDHDDDH